MDRKKKGKNVMLITEQPNYYNDNEENQYIKDIAECRYCKNFLKKDSKYQHGICLKVNDDPNADTKDSTKSLAKRMSYIMNMIKDQGGSFYWTHFIKHHSGSVKRLEKKSKKGKKYLNRASAEIGSRCANHWIKKEIKKFNPNIILTFGVLPTNWIIENADDIVDEFESYTFNAIANEHKAISIEFFNKKIQLLPFYHPSTRNDNKSYCSFKDDEPKETLKNELARLLKKCKPH
jgi:uracil-DNA glycosylase